MNKRGPIYNEEINGALIALDVGNTWTRGALYNISLDRVVPLQPVPTYVQVSESGIVSGDRALAERDDNPDNTFYHLMALLSTNSSTLLSLPSAVPRATLKTAIRDLGKFWQIYKPASLQNVTALHPAQALALFLGHYVQTTVTDTFKAGNSPRRVRSAVVSIPYYFYPAQERLVRLACEAAGLRVFLFTYSDFSSSHVYSVDRRASCTQRSAHILYVDWGASHLHVKVQRLPVGAFFQPLAERVVMLDSSASHSSARVLDTIDEVLAHAARALFPQRLSLTDLIANGGYASDQFQRDLTAHLLHKRGQFPLVHVTVPPATLALTGAMNVLSKQYANCSCSKSASQLLRCDAVYTQPLSPAKDNFAAYGANILPGFVDTAKPELVQRINTTETKKETYYVNALMDVTKVSVQAGDDESLRMTRSFAAPSKNKRERVKANKLWSTLSENHIVSSVSAELSELRALLDDLAASRSTHHKVETLQKYPQLRPLLQKVLDPNTTFGMSSKSFRSYIAPQAERGDTTATVTTTPFPNTLSLLDALAARKVTGNPAQGEVATFVRAHGLSDDNLDTLCKLIDRKLRVGFSVRTLNSAFADTIERFPSVALGYAYKGQALLSKSSPGWYASRKIDGARMVAFIDTESTSVTFYSRTGKQFAVSSDQSALAPIRDSLVRLAQMWQAERVDKSTKAALYANHEFVLDGEVALLSHTDGQLRDQFQRTMSLVKTEGAVETTQPPDCLPLSYYIFDVLTKAEFMAEMSPRLLSQRTDHALSLLARCKAVPDFQNEIPAFPESIMASNAPEGEARVQDFAIPIAVPGVKQANLYILRQHKVTSEDRLQQLMPVSARHGWEGIMLRKDDEYKGKRCRDIIKVKEFQDDEFKVTGVDVVPMTFARTQLPLYVPPSVLASLPDPRADELTLPYLRSITIQYKGSHQVSVGSGMSFTQRLEWAANPALIVGKTVTVSYFEESRRLKDSSENVSLSLRFPTLKFVHDESRRTI
ncbi:hypothetical protein RI367_004511 [Sorochytrium milnesiophthora]